MASKSVLCALAVVAPRPTVCLPLVAMPSIATYPIGLSASVLSLPRPAIVLDAISDNPLLSLLYN